MIEVRGVSKAFGSKAAVRGVSFAARPGEATGYLGPNGAGKSTTIKMIAGLLRPDDGEVRVCGFDVAQQPLEVKRRIGYVPESGALYVSLSPNEYLSLVAELHALDRALAARRMADLLAQFELSDASDRPIETLSKGMRQKVLLIGAFLHDPEVLLLDEPLNGLDVNAALTFRRMLDESLQRGRTVLYCSHILDVIERVCSHVIVIDQGQIIADDTTANLLAQQPQGTLESVFQALTRSGKQDEWARAFRDGAEPARPVASVPRPKRKR